MKKKIFAGVLALSMFLVPTARADELTDPYIKDIRNGNILPPQYEIKDDDGDGIDDDLGIRRDKVKPKDWIKSVESQDRGSIDGAIKWEKNQKEFKIKKIDQSGEPIEGVVFSVYNTKEDAEKNNKPLGSFTSDSNGYVKFTGLPLYYGFYVKETSVPDGYAISKEIIPVYRDNGVRFLGEMTAGQLRPKEANKGEDLNKYLQNLITDSYPEDFTDEINWLVFNDNGVEKLVPKKSLKRYISWNHIDDVGLVDGKKTVTIDEKTYKIRLMRAYSDEADPTKYVSNASEKGSEWNRLILPLIGVNGQENKKIDSNNYKSNPYGRFGYNTESYTEQNMPVLAEYTWWKDFGGNRCAKGGYCKDSYNGVYRWMQNVSRFNISFKALRGGGSSYYGAANSGDHNPNNKDSGKGWLPVLELAENN